MTDNGKVSFNQLNESLMQLSLEAAERARARMSSDPEEVQQLASASSYATFALLRLHQAYATQRGNR